MDAVPNGILPPARRQPTLIFEYEEAILYAVYRYHYLLLDQLVQLFGNAPTHSGWIQRRKIKPLVLEGFLYEQPLSRKSRAGGSPLVYSLAIKGKRCIEGLDCTVHRSTNPSEQDKTEGYLMHTLELNNILLLPHIFTRRNPQVTLLEWRHDLDMQHHKTRLPDWNGKYRYLVPDGWWDFSLDAPFHSNDGGLSFIVELDRGTMKSAGDFRDRIRDYCDFVYGAYQRDFCSNSLTILWVTTAGEKRVAWMRKQTMLELTSLNKMEHARYHRFLAIPPLFSNGVSPETFFLAPVWQTIIHDTLVSLMKQDG